MPSRVGAGHDRDAYARLGQLAIQKHRLREEHELWQRKLARISRRLAEIDSQTDRLRRQVAEMRGEQRQRFPGRPWREIEFPY
jgi:chaperonin cofactor prefoldin